VKTFINHTGIVVPLDRVDVDTDQIIPKQFLKRIERTGYGQFLFFDWRFQADGTPNPDFILNQPGYQEATVLVTGRNFGCGSSREHAPWALEDFGFRVIIAPSFADIFRNNCFQNGMLPVVLPEVRVAEMMSKSKTNEGYQVTVNLKDCMVFDSEGLSVEFKVDDFRRHCLLNGLDDIGLTLLREAKIKDYEVSNGLI